MVQRGIGVILSAKAWFGLGLNRRRWHRGCRYLVGGVVEQFMFPVCPGGTPDSGFSDRMMAMFLRCHPMGASSLGLYIGWRDKCLDSMAGRRSPHASRAVTKVERRAIYSIDDGESWWQGAAGSRRWIPFDGRVQEAGAVWHCGGVDDIRV